MVKQADRVSKLEKCRGRAPVIVAVVNKRGSWDRLWDSALHLGTQYTDGPKALSRMLAHHGHGSKPCPLCDKNNLDPNPIGHLLRGHQHGKITTAPGQVSEHLLKKEKKHQIMTVHTKWKCLIPILSSLVMYYLFQP